MYGDDKENNLGASVALSVEKEMKIDTDVDINERAQKILKKIVAVCDRKELVYTIRVIDDDVMNAFSLPGGYIYIYKKIITRKRVDNLNMIFPWRTTYQFHIVYKFWTIANQHQLGRLNRLINSKEGVDQQTNIFYFDKTSGIKNYLSPSF